MVDIDIRGRRGGVRPSPLGVVLLGPPGSGKGVQGRLLADHYGIAHVSTGEVLRAEVLRHTVLGQRVADAVQSGELVPDDVMGDVVAAAVGRLPAGRCGVVLDGYPRTVNQAARLLDGSIDVPHVIELHCPPAELLLRLSNRAACDRCGASTFGSRCPRCGSPTRARLDDRPSVAEQRLNDYHAQMPAVLEWFRQRDLLRVVNGLGPAEEVFRRIRAWIDRDVSMLGRGAEDGSEPHAIHS